MAKQIVRIEAPYLGLDTEAAPNAVGKNSALSLQNFLLGAPGRVKQRGSTVVRSAGPTGFGDSGFTWAVGNDRLLLGQIVYTGARLTRPWVATWNNRAATDLAKSLTGANEMAVYDINANTNTFITPTDRLRIPNGVRSARFGKFVYAIAFDSVDDTAAAPGGANGIEITNYGGNERLTPLLRWDASGTAEPVVYANAPKGCQDLRVWYGQLLMLGGRDPVTIANGIDHNAIWVSDALTAADFAAGIPDTVAEWTSDLSSAVNKISLSDDRGDPGVAFAQVGRALAVLKRKSIDLLTGYGPDTFQVRTVVRGTGCIDPHSIVETAEGCYFLSQHGYAFFDGSRVEIVSRQVNPTILANVIGALTATTLNTTWWNCHATLLDNSYILLTFGDYRSGPGPAPGYTFAYLFHTPTRTWAQVNIGSASGFGTSGHVASENYFMAMRHQLTGEVTFYDLSTVTTPEVQAVTTRGMDDVSTNIVSSWTSRLVELSSPLQKAKLHRILIDYAWSVNGGTDEQFTGPTVTVTDGTGTVLASYTLPSSASAATRKRHVQEVFEEANDIKVAISYNSTARALVTNAIYDVWVEYEPGAEKHSGV